MFWVLLAGCGGLRDGKLLRDLDREEAKELCDEYSDEQTAKCKRKGYCAQVSIGGPECNISGGGDAVLSSCDATVQNYRDCMDKLFADPCLLMEGLPNDCNWIRDCIPADTTTNPVGKPCD
jgi:hypothetical protein